MYECGNYEDSLLIYIMWSLASRPNEMLTLRFGDFEFTNNQATINYYSNKKNQRKKFTIPDDLYNEVIEFKSTKERETRKVY